jgi:hypothetical protein
MLKCCRAQRGRKGIAPAQDILLLRHLLRIAGRLEYSYLWGLHLWTEDLRDHLQLRTLL